MSEAAGGTPVPNTVMVTVFIYIIHSVCACASFVSD